MGGPLSRSHSEKFWLWTTHKQNKQKPHRQKQRSHFIDRATAPLAHPLWLCADWHLWHRNRHTTNAGRGRRWGSEWREGGKERPRDSHIDCTTKIKMNYVQLSRWSVQTYDNTKQATSLKGTCNNFMNLLTVKAADTVRVVQYQWTILLEKSCIRFVLTVPYSNKCAWSPYKFVTLSLKDAAVGTSIISQFICMLKNRMKVRQCLMAAILISNSFWYISNLLFVIWGFIFFLCGHVTILSHYRWKINDMPK